MKGELWLVETQSGTQIVGKLIRRHAPAGGGYEAPLGDRMRAHFKDTWLASRSVFPAMGGRNIGDFPDRVEATARAQGVDPMELFSKCLVRFLASPLEDFALRAPYACFAARFGELADRGPKATQEGAREAHRAEVEALVQKAMGGR